MHTGRMPCENEGRNQVILPQDKECQSLPANHPKLKERNGIDFSCWVSEESISSDT